MKQFITLLALILTSATFAQTGSVKGTLTDKQMNNEPLPFANVLIKDSTKGTTSNFDGLYTIENLEPGTYMIEVSFVGYETVEKPIIITGGDVTTLDVSLDASAAALDEVIIKTSVRRDTETALLLEQKKATMIKESIGALQLVKLGVSDAAGATAKISGVSKSEGSGDVFVRGLGDRYLYTTLNGLPIPSDDIEKK
ncbi:MAG: hypothetical protein ACI849_000708, partial [Patiriisocius sp.]